MPGPLLTPGAVQDNPATDYRLQALRAAERHGIDPTSFLRQMKQEGNFDPAPPANPDDGIAQIEPGTAKEWGVDPSDPVSSLDAAASHMRDYQDRYGDYRAAAVAYNGGPDVIESLQQKYGNDWEAHLSERDPKGYTGQYLDAIFGNHAAPRNDPGIYNLPPGLQGGNPNTDPGIFNVPADLQGNPNTDPGIYGAHPDIQAQTGATQPQGFAGAFGAPVPPPPPDPNAYVGSALQQHLSQGTQAPLDVTNPSDYTTLQEQVERATAAPQEGATYDPNVNQTRADAVLGPSDNPLAKIAGAYSAINPRIPVVTPAIENYLKPAVGAVTDALVNGPVGAFNEVSGRVGGPTLPTGESIVNGLVQRATGVNLPTAGSVAASMVPSRGADLALAALPLAGEARGALERAALEGIPEDVGRSVDSAGVRAVSGQAGGTPIMRGAGDLASVEGAAAGDIPKLGQDIPGIGKVQAVTDATINGQRRVRVVADGKEYFWEPPEEAPTGAMAPESGGTNTPPTENPTADSLNAPPLEQAPARDRLIDSIAQAKPLPAQTEGLRSAVRSQRAAAANSIMQGDGALSDRLAQRNAMLFQTGEMPRVSFEAPSQSFTPEEVAGFKQDIETHFAGRQYDAANAQRALDKMMDGNFAGLQTNEIQKLQDVFGYKMGDALLQKQAQSMPTWQLWLKRTLATPREAMTLGHPVTSVLQNWTQTFAHPLTTFLGTADHASPWVSQWVAFANQIKADPEAIQAFGDSLKSVYPELFGENIANTFHGIGTGGEEAFQGGWLSQIPGVRRVVAGSKDAMSTAQTAMRIARADDWATAFKESTGHLPSQEQADQMARWLNLSTGRGEVPQALKGTVAANLMGPRLFFSKFEQPVGWAIVHTPAARMQAASDLARAFTAVAGLTAVAKYGGGFDVNLNPLSTDWGKWKAGPLRLDPWGPFQNVARTISRLAMGQTETSTGNIVDASRSQTITRFLLSQLAPNQQTAESILAGQTPSGKALGWDFDSARQLVAQSVTPLFTTEVLQNLKTLGPVKGSAANAAIPFVRETNYESYGDTQDRVSQQMFGKAYGQLLPSQQSAVRNSPDMQANAAQFPKTPPDTAADSQRASFTTQQQQIDTNFLQGKLTRPWVDETHDLQQQRLGSGDFQRAYLAAAGTNTSASQLSPLLTGYHDATVYKDGQYDPDATKTAQDAYVANLSAQGKDGKPSDQAVLQDYLKYTESLKTPLQREHDKYLTDKEAAGYFAPGLTTAQRSALDKANPNLDVEAWKFAGGVTGGTAKDQALNSTAAVDQALALKLPNRPVKLAGIERPINQDAGSLAVWQQNKGLLDKYMSIGAQLGEKAAAQIYPDKKYADLTASQKGNVARQLHEEAMADPKYGAQLNAVLVYEGVTSTFYSPAAEQAFKAILQKAGQKPPGTKAYSLREAF